MSRDDIRKKKVLFIDFGSGFGGSVVNLAQILGHADALGIEPYVILDHDDKESLELLMPHASIVCLRHVKSILTKREKAMGCVSRLIRQGCFFVDIFFRAVLNIPFYVRIRNYACRVSADIVHFNNVVGLDEVIIGWIIGKKTICHAQHGFQTSPLLEFFLSRIDYFVAVSDFIKTDLLKARVPEEKIVVIYNALDVAQVKLRSKDACQIDLGCGYKVGLFGCLLPWKGQDILIDSAYILVHEKKMTDIHFFLIGLSPGLDRDYEKALKQKVRSLRLGDQVHLTGYLANVYPMMRGMDVVVHTSIEPEPFGLVLIEAMALGRPVIATAHGGPLEIIRENENGLFVPPGDARRLASVLMEILTDDKRCLRMGQEGVRTVAERFNIDLFIAAFKKLYFRIVTVAK